jgi:phosphate transport system substrate-binding protein
LLIQESSSGTYEFFKDEVMDKKNYATNILNLPATVQFQAVGQTKGAIGYIGLAYETKEVKQLAFLMIKEKHLLSHL